MSAFITFEGVEGAGKSTQLRRLATVLRAQGRTVVETREPGGTAVGTVVRGLLLDEAALPLAPMAELLLYLADRAQHVGEIVRPAIARGAIVLCDRFSDSTIAYQGHARGLDLSMVMDLDARARDGLIPDVTFVLDCDVRQGLARARARGTATDRFESETVAFHERVRAGFHALAARAPERYCIIDSTQPADDVGARIAAETLRRLGPA